MTSNGVLRGTDMLKKLGKISVLTMTAALFVFAFAGAAFAEEGDEELVVQPVQMEEPDLPVGGWAPAEAVYVPTDIVVNGSGSSDEMKSSKKRINADPNSVFSKGAASRGYEALDDVQQELYDAIHEEVCEFMEAESDLGPTPVKMSNGTFDYYIIGTANYYDLGITDDQEALKVFYAYDYDHPADYWISNEVLYNGKNLYLCTEKEYASVSTRRVLDTLVSDSVKAYAEMAEAGTSTLDKIAMVHDTIVNDIDYAYDSNGQPVSAKWAHSVHGVFDPQYEHAVCEGYADAFALIMNYMDIPNYYIVGTATTGGPGGGGGHAWNAVYDEDIDLYFYMDLTWDDLGEEDGYSYKYFGMPRADFEVSHKEQVPSAQMGEDWLYLIEGDFCDSLEGTYYYRGGFYYDGSTDADEFVAAAKAKAARSGGWVSVLCSDTDNLSIIAGKLGADGYFPASYEGTDYYISTAALGGKHTHNWSAPSYTWAPDNSQVTADRICEAPNCNVIAEVETVDTTAQRTEPTCTQEGSITYSATFTDPDFSVESKVVTLDALGHDWGEPTYEWADDNSTVTAKRVCQNNTEAGCTETETVDTTPETIEATCTKNGKTTYSATFENGAFSVEPKEVTIKALGHDWGTPTYEWADDNSTITAKRVCQNNTEAGCTETETVNTTSTVTTPATCTEDGQATFSATFENAAFSEQTKDGTVKALDHDWGEPTYKWADDNKTVTAKRECSRQCGDSGIETETANTTSKVTRAATYTAKGQTTYTAAFTNQAFNAQAKTLTNIPMLAKKANPMKVKAAAKTVKVKTLKKKALVVTPLRVTYAKGTVRYKVVGGNAKSKKALALNTKTGKVTVKKKTKKGKYQIKVKVTAAGTTEVKALSKTVTVTVNAK